LLSVLKRKGEISARENTRTPVIIMHVKSGAQWQRTACSEQSCAVLTA
jgi:hypothetical protein